MGLGTFSFLLALIVKSKAIREFGCYFYNFPSFEEQMGVVEWSKASGW